MADERTRRRRRSRRRKVLVVGVTAVVVAGGAGTAWAMSGSNGPSYRLSRVTRADLAQTVDADGTLTAQNTATQAFAAAGTVDSVLVKTGQHVTAGDPLALLDRSSLEAAVTSAKTTLATARQTLADNEAGQSSSSTAGSSAAGASDPTTSTTGSTTDATTTTTAGRDTVVLVSDETNTAGDPALTRAQAEVTAAQKLVVQAQSALDGDVADLSAACTTSGDTETTQQVTAASSGSAAGTVDDAAVVTIADDATTSDNPQTVASGGSWTFAGLTAGQTYRVVVVPVVDDTACTQAIDTVSAATGSASSTSAGTLHAALSTLTDAIGDLDTAAKAAVTSGASAGSGSGGGTGSGSSTGAGHGTAPSGGTTSGGSTSGGSSTASTSGSASGSTHSGTDGTSGAGTGSSRAAGSSSSGGSSSSSTTTITAAQIAADQKSIDAAKAALAVALNDMGLATLTTPISGTVASVGITSGSTVAASSSSDTIVITTDKALSVPVDISLADIDLIKVGESASVTVDGRSAPLDAKVSMIGLSNTSSSTGSSSEYRVTLVLDERDAKLYDGMGSTVSIDVGTAHRAVSVPVSAITTTGTMSTVDVYSAGTVSRTAVTLGVEGDSRVQIDSGVTVGDEVVLADLDETLPSSDSTSTSGSLTSGFTGSGRSSFGGGSGGPGGGTAGPP